MRAAVEIVVNAIEKVSGGLALEDDLRAWAREYAEGDAFRCGALRASLPSGETSERRLSAAPARGAPSPHHPLQLVEEPVELILSDVGQAVVTAGRLLMARRRVVNPEQVVHGGPNVAFAVPRLALADVKDHDAGWPLSLVGRLHGEGEAEAPLQADTADDRLERAG